MVRVLKAMVDRLQEMENIHNRMNQLSEEVGEDLAYKGETLQLPRGVRRSQLVTGVTTLFENFVKETVTATIICIPASLNCL